MEIKVNCKQFCRNLRCAHPQMPKVFFGLFRRICVFAEIPKNDVPAGYQPIRCDLQQPFEKPLVPPWCVRPPPRMP